MTFPRRPIKRIVSIEQLKIMPAVSGGLSEGGATAKFVQPSGGSDDMVEWAASFGVESEAQLVGASTNVGCC